MFVCLLPNLSNKSVPKSYPNKIARVAFGNSQPNDKFEASEFSNDFKIYINEIAKTNPESQKIVPTLLTAREGKYQRFIGSEIAVVVKVYKDETKDLFEYLLNEKEGEKLRFSGFSIETCLNFATKKNQQEIKELLSEKDKKGFIYSVYDVEFLMGVPPENRSLAKKLITPTRKNREPFKIDDAQKIMQSITAENKKEFEIMFNSQRFTAEGIINSLSAINNENRVILDYLLTEKDGKKNKFYSNSIVKILQGSKDSELPRLKFLTNQKIGDKHRFESADVAYLFVQSRNKEAALKLLIKETKDNKPRFSMRNMYQILDSYKSGNLNGLKSLLDFKIDNEGLLAEEITAFLKRINKAKIK
ncbi:MAG: hypothetical protein WCF95_04040 [bacterium]